ncbi:MAG: hypothetical protein ACXVCX_14360, partial [Ktedonobacterales bacterium]
MDLDDFIIAVFCLIDEAVPRVTHGQRLRQRGPQPVLADSEVLTMDVVGEYVGLKQSQEDGTALVVTDQQRPDLDRLSAREAGRECAP